MVFDVKYSIQKHVFIKQAFKKKIVAIFKAQSTAHCPRRAVSAQISCVELADDLKHPFSWNIF